MGNALPVYIRSRGHQAPSRDILKEPNIEKYLKNWGDDHDYALIALDGESRPVGAVWIRTLIMKMRDMVL